MRCSGEEALDSPCHGCDRVAHGETRHAGCPGSLISLLLVGTPNVANPAIVVVACLSRRLSLILLRLHPRFSKCFGYLIYCTLLDKLTDHC
jgi:hypothetical protein